MALWVFDVLVVETLFLLMSFRQGSTPKTQQQEKKKKKTTATSGSHPDILQQSSQKSWFNCFLKKKCTHFKYPMQCLWRLATHHVALIVISDSITVSDLGFIYILLCPDLNMPAIWNSNMFYSFLRDNCTAKKTSIMNCLCYDSWTVSLNCRLALCHPLTGYSMLFTIGY